ncbi:MAG: hypothetical protein IJ087_12180 [Eggerthellaceae bacterium]|nr:hypothetical protein [Eggerthellaceae bacterium]
MKYWCSETSKVPGSVLWSDDQSVAERDRDLKRMLQALFERRDDAACTVQRETPEILRLKECMQSHSLEGESPILDGLGNVVWSEGQLNLNEVLVMVPFLRERYFGLRRIDVMPEARPLFLKGGKTVSGLYSGIDYLLEYFRAESPDAPIGECESVASITRPGNYWVLVVGMSEKLRGRKAVPFTVKKRALFK